jgi:hypothetical protein
VSSDSGPKARGDDRCRSNYRLWSLARVTFLGLSLAACAGHNDAALLPGPSAGGNLGSSAGGCTSASGCNSGGGSPALTAPEDLFSAPGCGEVRLALGGDTLYWTERQSGRVRSIAVTGGTVNELASGQVAPRQIAVDDSAAYWFTAGDGSAGSSQIVELARAGQGAPVVLKTTSGSDVIASLAVDAGKVYYGLGPNIHAISADPSDSTDVVVGVAFARTDTRMPDGIPDGLAVHDARVYWIVADVGSVESDDLLPGTDGMPRVGHSGELWPNDLGFAGDYVYYAAFESLYAAQAGTPAIAVASSTNDATLGAFAVNAQDGYFADAGGGISRHNLALPAAPDFQATPSTPVAQGQGNVTSVVLDAKRLYWAAIDASGGCAIRTLPL